MTDISRLTPKVVEALRADNEKAKKSGWKAEIGVDDLDLLLDTVELLQRWNFKTPDQWCKELGATIVDPDGWRNAKKSYDDPVTKAEFDQLMKGCTIDMRGYPHFIGTPQ